MVIAATNRIEDLNPALPMTSTLRKIAEKLIEKETLTGDEVRETAGDIACDPT
ncbi:MAG: hypothetical protein PUI16_02590 [Clostridia bacterium]|nr:hypothetical protein [Clostridia bacterium]